MGNKTNVIAVAFAIFMLNGCATINALQLVYGNQYASHIWDGESKNTTLPLTILNDHTIVMVSVNGVDKLRMVLDTGAAATVLFETEKTRSLGKGLNSKITTGGIGSNNPTDVYFMHDTTLRLGSLQISGLTTLFIKAKDNPIFSSPELAYIDGVIGFDLFSRFVTDVNYSQQTVSIYEQLYTAPQDYTKIPLSIKNNIPYIELAISDQSSEAMITAMLDTGGVGPLLLSANDKLPLGKVVSQSQSTGLGGQTEISVNRMQRIDVGGHSISRPLVAVSHESSSPNIAGTGITNRFNMIIDYPSQQLYINPNERFSKPDIINKFGTSLFPHKHGAYIVDIQTNTPAERLNFQKGDIITSINGTAIHYGNFDVSYDHLKQMTSVTEICLSRENNTLCQEVQQ